MNEYISVGVKCVTKGFKVVSPYVVPVLMAVAGVKNELKAAKHIDGLEKRIVDLEKLVKH